MFCKACYPCSPPQSFEIQNVEYEDLSCSKWRFVAEFRFASATTGRPRTGHVWETPETWNIKIQTKLEPNVYKFFLQTQESFCCPILLVELLELGSVVKQTPPCLWKGSRKRSLSPGWNRLKITHVGGPTRSSRICPLVQPCNILMIRATSEV